MAFGFIDDGLGDDTFVVGTAPFGSMERHRKKCPTCGTTDGYWGSVQSGTFSFFARENAGHAV